MKLTRLKIVGFKSFVEPADFHIEPGLTGVVGPNGCGKSNLVEALRWVMGESSHKSMRASGMDDVIFAGSGNRPARNSAEVTLTIDNGERIAPAAFNDADTLEVSRKIVRESGSTYRINGREVRARDVQLLFADAATGARSPAMVRQGQIGELIAAKPQARRRILEDAAGIAGLHTRRHEAELRLRAAEDNLQRLEDVLGEIGGQIDGLRRQGRQAQRYRALSADIRKLEAMLALIAYREARDQAAAAERELEAHVRDVAEATRVQAETARLQAIAAHEMPKLREAAAEAGAALQRLVNARAELDNEERRAKDRAAELVRRRAELDRDLAREKALAADAAASAERLGEEDAALAAEGEDSAVLVEEAQAALVDLDSDLVEAEATLAALQQQVSDLNAHRAGLERAEREEAARAERLAGERRRIEAERAALDAEGAEPEAIARLAEEIAIAEERLEETEIAAAEAREALAAAREAEARLRAPASEAGRQADRLEAEAATLAKLFAAPAEGTFAPVVDALAVDRGFEAALGAALGDDLDLSTDPAAPARWTRPVAAMDDPPLPAGAQPLAAHVRGVPELARRLSQVGLVAEADGERLSRELKPGQTLVSSDGAVWRWDGLVAEAGAPTAATRRLAERNRLNDLLAAAAEAREEAETHRAGLDRAQVAIREAVQRESDTLEAARGARRALDGVREQFAAAERRAAQVATRRSALDEALSRIIADEEEARRRIGEAREALARSGDVAAVEKEVLEARTRVAERRSAAAEARAAAQTLQREAELRARRREAIAAEVRAWKERRTRALAAVGEIEHRIEETVIEQATLEEAPEDFEQRRRALVAEIEAAEERRREAGDQLAEGETKLAEADKAARAALEQLSAAREARAGTEARLEAARARLADVVRHIGDSLDSSPAALHELAGVVADAALPPAGDVEGRVAQLKADRERLGAVNLRADIELEEAEGKREALVKERDDLTEAIRRLRQAIASLNKEGRERLLAAFDVVNGHFQRLFTTLFGGGSAELSLVDSDDPLEAGLEIFARPPGKKPQVMTLLSGGEQALTATALIFAVFLTNPSPICVLDEVDAPLDDANVERYCDLLQDMVRQTQTRFLVITHNPITMARMNRLFGVTMAERGVSQLVSVDLAAAEQILEAV